MGQDIAITWDNTQGRGDWSVANGDLALGNALLSSVMVSLFTDRVAPTVPTSADQAAGLGTQGGQTFDRRGWWADAAAYNNRPIGSRLWQLKRAVKGDGQALAQDAEDICTEALQWLLDDGVTASVTCSAAWASATALLLRIAIVEPGSSSATKFEFAWAWEGLN